MLYRIRNPNIKKLALVKRPASGHRWHLLKSAPETDEDAELEAFVDSLSREEAEELVEACAVRPSIEERLDAAEARLAKAEPAIRARRALGVIAKSAAPPEEQLAALVHREEIRERQQRIIGEMRSRPSSPDWLYNKPTATAQETADMVMALRAADPSGSRPRWAM